MANMSYCRFSNTVNDMRDVRNVMCEAESMEDLNLSGFELAAFKAMGPLLEEMLELHNFITENADGTEESA